MKLSRKTLLTALSLFAMAQPQAAYAQQCVSGSEAAALFVYAMPPAIEAVSNSCDGRLKSNGFLATSGNRLIARYAALQDETWPKARKAALALLSGNKGSSNPQPGLSTIDPAAIFQTLPDNVARPLGDALIMQKVAEQVRPEKCHQIELVLHAMSPIEPRDAGALLGAVANLVGMDNLALCKVD